MVAVFYEGTVFPLAHVEKERLQQLADFTVNYMIDSDDYGFEKAKAMHKEEIKDAQIDGSMNSTLVEYRIPHYYNETFGGNNEQH